MKCEIGNADYVEKNKKKMATLIIIVMRSAEHKGFVKNICFNYHGAQWLKIIFHLAKPCSF